MSYYWLMSLKTYRKTCLSYYRLDPANYLSAPGLAWDAMLLKTNIQLDLINDLETLDFIERSKRGGLCFVGSQRHAKANNKYLDDATQQKNQLTSLTLTQIIYTVGRWFNYYRFLLLVSLLKV